MTIEEYVKSKGWEIKKTKKGRVVIIKINKENK